uniref:Uncharacterized protein n=1 Tax=Oryza brachyantha TaxID=4533 RepID=J3LGQ5_ORYBR
MELSNPLVYSDLSASGTRSTYFSDIGKLLKSEERCQPLPIFTAIRSSESQDVIAHENQVLSFLLTLLLTECRDQSQYAMTCL